MTLPAVHALEASVELRRLLRPGLTEGQRQRANDLIRGGGGVQRTLDVASEHLRRAVDQFRLVSPSHLRLVEHIGSPAQT